VHKAVSSGLRGEFLFVAAVDEVVAFAHVGGGVHPDLRHRAVVIVSMFSIHLDSHGHYLIIMD